MLCKIYRKNQFHQTMYQYSKYIFIFKDRSQKDVSPRELRLRGLPFLRQLPIPLVDLHVSPLPQLFPTLTATGVPPTNLQDIFTLQFLERMEVPCCNQKYDAVKTQVSLWRKIAIQPDFLDNRWTLGLLTG